MKPPHRNAGPSRRTFLTSAAAAGALAWIPAFRVSPASAQAILGSTVPAAVSAGQASTDGWSTAVSVLTSYDPNAVFSNPFLDTLMG